jgi:DNA-binding PadR family transcriptional regulator
MTRTGRPRTRRYEEGGTVPTRGSRSSGGHDATPSGTLDLALLGLLVESSMHGYELRARLIEVLGAVRSYSYGSLYPALKRLQTAELIAVEQPLADPDSLPLTPKRRRVTYHITAAGKEHLDTLLSEAGPQSFTDDGFGVYLAFFPRTTVETRLRILEGRRRRIEERREGLRTSMTRAVQRMDDYTRGLQELAIEASDREVRWLSDLISQEQRSRHQTPGPTGGRRRTPRADRHTRGDDGHGPPAERYDT